MELPGVMQCSRGVGGEGGGGDSRGWVAVACSPGPGVQGPGAATGEAAEMGGIGEGQV